MKIWYSFILYIYSKLLQLLQRFLFNVFNINTLLHTYAIEIKYNK